MFFFVAVVDQSEGQGHICETKLSDIQGRELHSHERIHLLPEDGALYTLPW